MKHERITLEPRLGLDLCGACEAEIERDEEEERREEGGGDWMVRSY